MLKKLTSRERRFIKFASVEYCGQLYMTPQDFLDSVVEQEPRRKHKIMLKCAKLIKFFFFIISARLKRRVLTEQDLQVIKDNTPPLKKGSKILFRTLRDRGNFYSCYFCDKISNRNNKTYFIFKPLLIIHNYIFNYGTKFLPFNFRHCFLHRVSFSIIGFDK